MSKAILLYGPPGAGKGTQTGLLAHKYNLVNFDTGSHLEIFFSNPKNLESRKAREEKERFDNGILTDPKWVLKIVKKQVKIIAGSGASLILSGSPRTLYEAFGDPKTKGVLDVILDYYGKKNIYAFEIYIPEHESANRNASRTVCKLCRTSILKHAAKLKKCPVCGGKLYRRMLDNPEVMEERLNQYKNRTYPIIKEMKKRGFNIRKIRGTGTPSEVFNRISSKIKWA